MTAFFLVTQNQKNTHTFDALLSSLFLSLVWTTTTSPKPEEDVHTPLRFFRNQSLPPVPSPGPRLFWLHPLIAAGEYTIKENLLDLNTYIHLPISKTQDSSLLSPPFFLPASIYIVFSPLPNPTQSSKGRERNVEMESKLGMKTIR